ncbi:MAG: transaldolase [Anaerolineaceae bacterium]|nr:MAG: transaldolase [Anaerolineaceae bacterium]
MLGNKEDTILCSLGGIGIVPAKSDEAYIKRILDKPISYTLYSRLKECAKIIGVTDNFKEVIDYFKVPAGETPAGFRIGYSLEKDGLIKADLVRDISYDKNNQKRPTKVLFSADSANPYEIVHIKDLIANLTCNPAIIYNLFINNPKANIHGEFKTRDEVMMEIARVLGPGCDISVELNDPFRSSESEMLEEAAKFKEMLGKWRVVIKVPHTGPVNAENIEELLTNDKQFARRYYEGRNEDRLRGHNLALMMKENGYRVNFTLMFEPYQTALALQAKPYFINSFVMFRQTQTARIKGLLAAYEASGDEAFLEQLRIFMVENDYLSSADKGLDIFKVKVRAEWICNYRGFDRSYPSGFDGLDNIRHNLRVIKQCNIPDTRLIICNFQGETLYPYIDTLLAEKEFEDVLDRIVITSAPEHLSQFTSSPLVLQFHRRFMNAAAGQK